MTDGDCDRLFERAGAALRAPSPDEDRARDRTVRAIYAESSRVQSSGRTTLLPGWSALAAAALAFAVGIGTGRATVQRSVAGTMNARGAVDSGQRKVEFVFVAPSARNVSLVGDFNGWDATATPMR